MPGADNARAVVFFADTFNRYFEPENIEAALGVLTAAGYGVHLPKPADGSSRPLCCGRTFLAVGLVDEARLEAERCVAALAPLLARGMPVVGLEPSCILGFRDELPALIKGDDGRRARSTCRSSRWPNARSCTAIATRNRSGPWARRKRCSSSSRS
jgi:Fe-S oxidoreductase